MSNRSNNGIPELGRGRRQWSTGQPTGPPIGPPSPHRRQQSYSGAHQQSNSSQYQRHQQSYQFGQQLGVQPPQPGGGSQPFGGQSGQRQQTQAIPPPIGLPGCGCHKRWAEQKRMQSTTSGTSGTGGTSGATLTDEALAALPTQTWPETKPLPTPPPPTPPRQEGTSP